MKLSRLLTWLVVGSMAACTDPHQPHDRHDASQTQADGDARADAAADADARGDAGADAGAPDAGALMALAGAPDELAQAYASALAQTRLQLRREPCGRRTFGGGSEEAECLTTRVPLSWRDPDRGEIALFAKRMPAPEPARRQLWLLQGGPGIPGFIGEAPADDLQAALRDADVFIVDYRGVGRSELLDCPNEPGLLPFDSRDDEWPARAERCFAEARAQWGDDIYSFNVIETAMDVAALIQASRVADRPVHLYGWSWGTRVAHALLRIFPAAVDSVVLDSFVPPGPAPDADAEIDRVARLLLQACERDAECAARFDSPPESFAEALLERLRQGHCPQLAERGIDVQAFQQMLGLAVIAQADLPLLPALIYRADRCSDDDVVALARFNGNGAGNNLDLLPVKLSPVLQMIQLQPLTRDDSAAEIEARYDSRLALSGLELRSAWIRQVVPAGPARPFEDDPWAEPQSPLLVLQGELDSVTPASGVAAAQAHFTASQHRFVEIENAAHALLRQLPCTAQVVSPWLQHR